MLEVGLCFFFQAEDGIRDYDVTGVQTCALPISGGPDGLACYRALVADLARLLGPGGRAIIEVGAGRADDVAAIMAEGGLVEIGRRRDLAGIERCILLHG